ncbi:hypothetical protein FACS189431_3900 [Alphaproteobacteria bacterium]|nr:hypothetical protein FACS189431_3900 [Alphaproteobacteria bacterium]
MSEALQAEQDTPNPAAEQWGGVALKVDTVSSPEQPDTEKEGEKVEDPERARLIEVAGRRNRANVEAWQRVIEAGMEHPDGAYSPVRYLSERVNNGFTGKSAYPLDAYGRAAEDRKVTTDYGNMACSVDQAIEAALADTAEAIKREQQAAAQYDLLARMKRDLEQSV